MIVFLWAGIFLYLQSTLNPWDASKTNENREISLICFCFVVSIQEHNHGYRQATRWPPGGLTRRHSPLHSGDYPAAPRSAHPDTCLQPFLFLTSSSYWLSPVAYIKAALPLHLPDLLFSAAGFFSQRLPNWCPGQCFPSPPPLLPFWFTSTLFLTTKGRIGKGPKCFWILFISSNKPSHFIKLILTTFLANSYPWHQSDPMHLPGGLTGVTVPWTLEPQTKPSTTACLNRISSVYHVNAMAKYTQYVQGAQTLDLNSCARGTWPGHPVVTQPGSQMSCMVWAGRWQSPFPAL